jgi:Uma2 family endonuclease
MAVKIAEAAPPATKTIPPDNAEFPYGWRIITETRPDGSTYFRDVPLTPDDFLDPQEGDTFVHNSLHNWLSALLFTILYNYYLDDPNTAVFSDLKMVWGLPNLQEPAPDIAVVPNITHKERARSVFNVVQERTRPGLVIEIVSPNYPGDDTTKVSIYQQAGITEYIILDPHSDDETAPFTLQGYRLVRGTYQKIAPDAQGRLFSETTRLYLGLAPGHRQITLTEAATGRQLLTPQEEKAARELAELLAAQQAEVRELAEAQAFQEAAARELAESRADQAESRAAQAEARAAQEAVARRAAENRATEEAVARRAAESRATQAESRATEEAAARRAAEAELARLLQGPAT